MKKEERGDYYKYGFIKSNKGYKKLENTIETEFTSESESCEPTEELKSPKPVPFTHLFRYATPFELALVVTGVVLGAVTGLFNPVFVVLFGEYTTLLVDRSVGNTTSSKTTLLSIFGGGKILVNGSYEERMEALNEDAVAFAIASAFYTCIQLVMSVTFVSALNYSAIRQVTRIRRHLLTSLLRQDQGWHDVHGTTSVANSLTEDLDKLKEAMGEKIGICLYQLVTFLSTIAVSFVYGWKLTLAIVSSAPLIIVAMGAVSKVQSLMTLEQMASYRSAGAVVEEVLSAIRTVVAFGGEEKEVERYNDALASTRTLGVKRGLYTGLGYGVYWFISHCTYAVALWYGVTLILHDRDAVVKEYTPQVLIIVLFAVIYGSMKMGLSAPHLEAFATGRGAAGAIFHILDQEPDIDSLSQLGYTPARNTGNISLTNVHFQYPARPDVKVLNGFSLKVSRGQTVALVGQSGCGKSTVLQLIQRLYDPQQGRVTLDGEDVRDLNIQWLRGSIGVVGQQPVLFDTTIRDNISYGVHTATGKEIRQAAREANAHDFIRKLPQGYHTMVGDRGVQLSGGQKQRVAIARALVRQPSILLLDEATSALDRAGEIQVQTALDHASKGRTTIVVSHRLATIKSADCIVVMAEGRVVEKGTHDELMKLQGHYHQLVMADNTETLVNEKTQVDLPTDFKNISIPSKNRHLSKSDKKTKEKLNIKTEEELYPAPFSRLMGLNKPEWGYIVIGCIAALVAGCNYPLFSILYGHIYKTLSLENADEVREVANMYSVLFLALAVTTGLGTFLESYIFGIVGVRLLTRLRTKVFTAILQQEVGWFDEEQNSVGTLCARLAGDADTIQGLMGTHLSAIVNAISTLLVGIIVSLYFSWRLTIVSMVIIPFILAVIYMDVSITQRPALQEKNALERATKVAVEAVSQLRTVASLCAELSVLRRYEVKLAKAQQVVRVRTWLRGAVFGLVHSVPMMSYAWCFWYGGYLVTRQNMPYEYVLIVSETVLSCTYVLTESLINAPSLGTARLSASRIFYLLDRQPLVADPLVDRSTEDLSGNIEMSHVNFSYPSRPEVPVLQDLSLLVQPGKTVALVGASGCGKSTCLQLLQRFYDPSFGTLMFGANNIAGVPLKRLRRELGIVSQEPVLFDRTIQENIAYGDNERQVPIHEIIAAAEKANIHTFIASLPQGYYTRLGQNGAQLSGGQKQRVAIARALVRNPRLLILDEATSALDTQSEKVVQAALDTAREGRTCITIAHRLGTIQNSDVICVIQHGTVVESGTHAELLALNGHYCQLAQGLGTALGHNPEL